MQLQQYQYIDPGGLLATVGGDWKIFRGLAQTFIETAPNIFTQLEGALVHGDHAAVRRESHSLKGMAALVGAHALTEALRNVETDARDGKLPAAELQAGLASLFSQVMADMHTCLRDSANHLGTPA